MLLNCKCLLEMSHQMTSNVMNLGPLLQNKYNAHYDENCRQYAHPAHETMRLSTAETKSDRKITKKDEDAYDN